MTVSPVFAEEGAALGKTDAFIKCSQKKWKEDKRAMKDCFRDLANAYE